LSKAVDDVGGEGQRIAVLDREVIESSIVLNESEASIFLFDEEYWGGDRGL
jgi:hypothetical protein